MPIEEFETRELSHSSGDDDDDVVGVIRARSKSAAVMIVSMEVGLLGHGFPFDGAVNAGRCFPLRTGLAGASSRPLKWSLLRVFVVGDALAVE